MPIKQKITHTYDSLQNLNNLLAIAIEASLTAGEKIMVIYNSGDFNIGFKKDQSPLTEADIASHEIIKSFLKPTNIPILSEEGKHLDFINRSKWDRIWIVDPIDGTKEFINKNGEFTVNIALVENQVPILGVIYAPALNELYFSSKDCGAFKVNNCNSFISLNDLLSNANRLPLQIDKRKITVVASKSHLSKETEDYIKELKKEHGNVTTLSKGSSLKLCMVAEGIADEYPRYSPTMEWDTAAGHAICKYAGKNVYSIDTKKEMLYNKENLMNSWFLVK